MGSEMLIVACDFGTTIFRTLVTEITAGGRIRVLGCGEIPAAGFQDGDFIDMSAGSRCVARAVRAVEAAADVDIAAFYYNISGSHLRSVWSRGQIQIGPRPRAITSQDLEAVLDKARSLAVPYDSWILAVNPVDYAVDRVRGIVDPCGRIGSQLEVQAHLIAGSRSVVRNVEHAISLAGYDVAGRAVDVLAAATSLVKPREKEQGVILIDVGGWSTQWAVFRRDRIVGNGTIPCGGCHLTGDLAHGLRIERESAEKIKRQRGVVLRSLAPETDPELLFEEARPEQTPGLLAAILEPRLEEIFSLVKADLGEALRLNGIGAGVILTGGGSRCQGSAELCEEVFGLPVQCRYLPDDLDGAEMLGDGQWATAVGLSIWAAGMPCGAAVATSATGAGRLPLWGKVRQWLQRPAGEDRTFAARN
jgi:cell division protein FtsA